MHAPRIRPTAQRPGAIQEIALEGEDYANVAEQELVDFMDNQDTVFEDSKIAVEEEPEDDPSSISWIRQRKKQLQE